MASTKMYLVTIDNEPIGVFGSKSHAFYKTGEYLSSSYPTFCRDIRNLGGFEEKIRVPLGTTNADERVVTYRCILLPFNDRVDDLSSFVNDKENTGKIIDQIL